MRTREGGSLNIEGFSKEGLKTSNALIAADARFLVHSDCDDPKSVIEDEVDTLRGIMHVY